MENIVGVLKELGKISGSLSSADGIAGNIVIPEKISPESYIGDYVITPSNAVQEIDIAKKVATRNIVINPIPENYGLITWDGSTLTVS